MTAALSVKDIARHCAAYQGADERRSLIQLLTTLALYAAMIFLMFYSLGIGYWLTLLLAVPTAGLLTRLFIFQHDCGHGSFFNSKGKNDWVGRGLSILTIIPYDFWRKSHNMHHATSGHLDHRNVGGIDTITVREYQAFSPFKKLLYRIYRNPVVLLLVGTPIYLMIFMRFPHNEQSFFLDTGKVLNGKSRWKGLMLTNLSLAVFYGGLGMFLGIGAVFSVFLPVIIMTSWIGGWLFFIQHQFEETYWQGGENWSLQEANLHGSSYYELPSVFQWLTGNIGLHHIHHLSSKIPNYKLQECMNSRPELRDINRIRFLESLKCVRFKLWDEQKKCLVGFDQV